MARIDRTENFFAASKATIRHGGNRTYFAQEIAYVQMPPFKLQAELNDWNVENSNALKRWPRMIAR